MCAEQVELDDERTARWRHRCRDREDSATVRGIRAGTQGGDPMAEQTTIEREADVVATLLRLGDTMVQGYDQLELLRDLAESSVRILDGDTAGVSLSTGEHLGFVVATSEAMDIIELFQMERQQGPCMDAFRSGEVVHTDDIETDRSRWPLWAPKALSLGFRSADAFPMRLHDTTIGALNVYAPTVRGLDDRDITLGTALANMATIGIVHEGSARRQALVQEQLQQALDSRVIIEQAKGVLAQRHGLTPDDAFARLRHHARSTNEKLATVARLVVHEQLDLAI
jgi:hypothetical protein